MQQVVERLRSTDRSSGSPVPEQQASTGVVIKAAGQQQAAAEVTQRPQVRTVRVASGVSHGMVKAKENGQQFRSGRHIVWYPVVWQESVGVSQDCLADLPGCLFNIGPLRPVIEFAPHGGLECVAELDIRVCRVHYLTPT